MVQLDSVALRGPGARALARLRPGPRLRFLVGVWLTCGLWLPGPGSAPRAECECDVAPCPCQWVAAYSTRDELTILYQVVRMPLVLLGDDAYLCPCPARTYGGAAEERVIGGDTEDRNIRGSVAVRTTEEREPSGVSEQREYGGQSGRRNTPRSRTVLMTCCPDPSCPSYRLSTADSSRVQIFDGFSIRPVEHGCVE